MFLGPARIQFFAARTLVRPGHCRRCCRARLRFSSLALRYPPVRCQPAGTWNPSDPHPPPDPTSRSALSALCPGWCNLPRCYPHCSLCILGLAPLQHSAPKPFRSCNPPLQPLVVSSASLWGVLSLVASRSVLSSQSFPFFSASLDIPLPTSGDLPSTTSPL